MIAYHIGVGVAVLSAVNFNNEKSFAADEITDVVAYRLLPYKFIPADLAVTNTIPQDCFRVRLVDA